MKHLNTLVLALLCSGTAAAQTTNTTYQPGDDNNPCALNIAFDEVDDLTESSFTLSLTNPSTPISVLSAYFTFDDNTIRPWSYDPVSKTYDVEMNVYSKKNKEGRVTSQALQTQLSDDTNPEHPGYFYLAIAGSDDFLGEEGEMATVYFDATQFADGYHVLHMKDALCGTIIGTDPATMSSITYLCADQEITFHVGNGTITIIDGIQNIYPPYPAVPTYDLLGRPADATRPGLYIRGGKKVIR